MAFKAKTLFIALALAAVVLAGCSSGAPKQPTGGEIEAPPEVEVTETTGGIRGVVIDDAIRPIKGATVEVKVKDEIKSLVTPESGTFALSGLDAGVYFIKASHPFYSDSQQSVEVIAGEANPPAIKIQLLRTIFDEPYFHTLVFDGFIACSQDFSGLLFSEECGEGVGTPCTVQGQTVPPPGCTRVGRTSSNRVQYDFFPAFDNPQSMLVELIWKPTVGAATTGTLWTVVETNFKCTPTCTGTHVMNADNAHFGNCAASPSYIRDDTNVQKVKLNSTTKVSTFTWACGKGGTVPYDLQINQQFREFVTMSYVLPLPEGWSFVKNSPPPF